MDFLKDLLKSDSSEMLGALTANGFSKEQAEQFLPEAGSSLVSAMSNVSDTSDQDSVLGGIDVAALAGKTGLDASLVQKGLNTLLPLVMNKIGGGGLGGLLGKAKSLF